MASAVWGIDISRYSIKAVRLEADAAGAVRLTKVDVLNIPGSSEPEAADAAIAEGLQQIKKRCRIGGDSVACSLPGHSTFNRIIKLPPVEAEKLDEIVKYEAQSQIPFPLDEVVWDYQHVAREYLAGEEQEVMLFAVKREIVEKFLTAIEAAMLSVDVVQFAPVAMFNFLAYDTEISSGTIALDFGADNTDLLLTDGFRFWIRNIPVTGNQVTKALADALKKPFAEAERIKRKAAQSKKAQAIYAAMQPVYQELAGEVHRSLGYFKSISRTARFDQAILMGNGSKGLNFQRFMGQNLRLTANRIQKFNKIEVAGSADQAVLAANLGALGTAVGLALQGLGLSSNKVNLLPVRFVRAKQIKKKEPLAIVAAILLLVTAVLAYNHNDGRKAALLQKVEDIQTARSSYDTMKANVEAVENLDGPVAALVEAERIYSVRDYIPRILDTISPNVPDNGNPALDPKQKVWVLSWRIRETSSDALQEVKEGPYVAAKNEKPKRRLPDKRRVVLTLEAAIAGDYDPTKGTEHIQNTLLNWNGKSRIADARPSALEVHGLWVPENELRIDYQSEVKLLLPKDDARHSRPGDLVESETPYRLFLITITYTPGTPPAPEAAGG